MPKTDRPRDRRQRIPHGKLLPARSVKSGMVIWHPKARQFRTVQRTGDSNGCVDLYMANGLGTPARRAVFNRERMIFVRITQRATRRKQEQQP